MPVAPRLPLFFLHRRVEPDTRAMFDSLATPLLQDQTVCHRLQHVM
jgi:hypothetical protein